MYIPRAFRQENIEQLLDLIEQDGFATLVTPTESGIEATHLPMLLEQSGEQFTLKAHIARANPLWKRVQSGSEVLAVFHGPNCYISPNHYPTKAENGRAVPTWNYAVVHVKGAVSFVTDDDWLYRLIDDLTNKHESGSSTPWSITDAPDGYIQKMLPAIVGIEVAVSKIEGQWKLSQNQPRVNQDGVVSGLSALDSHKAQSMAAMVQAQIK